MRRLTRVCSASLLLFVGCNSTQSMQPLEVWVRFTNLDAPPRELTLKSEFRATVCLYFLNCKLSNILDGGGWRIVGPPAERLTTSEFDPASQTYKFGPGVFVPSFSFEGNEFERARLLLPHGHGLTLLRERGATGCSDQEGPVMHYRASLNLAETVTDGARMHAGAPIRVPEGVRKLEMELDGTPAIRTELDQNFARPDLKGIESFAYDDLIPHILVSIPDGTQGEDRFRVRIFDQFGEVSGKNGIRTEILLLDESTPLAPVDPDLRILFGRSDAPTCYSALRSASREIWARLRTKAAKTDEFSLTLSQDRGAPWIRLSPRKPITRTRVALVASFREGDPFFGVCPIFVSRAK